LPSGFSRRWFASICTALLWSAVVCPAVAANTAEKKQQAREQFEEAEHARAELNNRPSAERTAHDYQRVADQYRRVYYLAPTSSKADSAVNAVAELLAEAGRRFNNARMLDGAVGQYEFLRREYPGSKYRVNALLSEGLIYKEDLGDRVQAKAMLTEFLRRYPRSTVAERARVALTELEQAPVPPAKSQAADHPPKNRQEEAHTALPTASPGSTPASPASASSPSKSAAAGETATPVRSGPLPQVTNIRSWSTPNYTRVVIDLEDEVQYQAGRVPDPDRIFFDLHDTKLGPALIGKSFEVEDGFLRKIRVAQYQKTMTRVVLEVDDVSDYSAFLVPNPFRLIIDIHGRQLGKQRATGLKSEFTAAKNASPPPGDSARASTEKAKAALAAANPQAQSPVAPAEAHSGPGQRASKAADGTTAPLKFDETPPASATVAPATKPPAGAPSPAPSSAATGTNLGSEAGRTATAASHPSPSPDHPVLPAKPPLGTASESEAVTANATRLQPDASPESAAGDANLMARLEAPDLRSSKPTTAPTFETVAPRPIAPRPPPGAPLAPVGREARPTAGGGRSLTRALGLKIGRIVVDAGHGGHDTGTVGPGGLEEKALTLDVATRLGKLLESKLGAEVIYTRTDDTFVPLETRTAIANQNQADLFISIHANSSEEVSVRGIETYYLNFTSSADALEVAARENAVSEKSVYELQDLVKKIALKEKIEESREFAGDVQRSLWGGLSAKNPTLRNRGVRKAPFIVLIGANMPSILAEISFLSNPADARKLNTEEYRQRIAEYLYRGIAQYANGLSGVKVAKR